MQVGQHGRNIVGGAVQVGQHGRNIVGGAVQVRQHGRNIVGGAVGGAVQVRQQYSTLHMKPTRAGESGRLLTSQLKA